MKVYLIFGPQGSGKSTQAQLLADYLKLPFFDSGKQLRDVVASGSQRGATIRRIMQEGKLVPNEYLQDIFADFITDHDCEKGIVVDGFPRNMVQVELFERLSSAHRWDVTVIFIDISDQTAKDRLGKRFSVVNGRKVVRDDDQPGIVEKRLQVFKRETMPVIDWLKDRHRYYRVDGEPPREKVFENVTKVIDEG